MEIGNDVVARDAEKTAFFEIDHGETERMLVSQRVWPQDHIGNALTSLGLVQPAIGKDGTGKRLCRYEPAWFFIEKVESGPQHRVPVNEQVKQGIEPVAVKRLLESYAYAEVVGIAIRINTLLEPERSLARGHPFGRIHECRVEVSRVRIIFFIPVRCLWLVVSELL